MRHPAAVPALRLALALCLLSLPTLASSSALQRYQLPDGAITVYLAGNTVDPYFAAKALLAARQAGADETAATRDFIAWLLPRQKPDGRFERYCRQDWKFIACASADADDALLAVWMELLVSFAPQDGMPAAWAESLARASQFLLTLRDRRLGVYQISRDLPVALLMDNIEVISAFRALANWQLAQGKVKESKAWHRRADALAKSVRQVFQRPDGSYRVSTQSRTGNEFYPDRVAQVFPLLGDMEGAEAAANFGRWLRANRGMWFEQAGRDYPWALVALAAYKVGDRHTVACWRAHAAPFRHGSHWNVLEEVIFVALGALGDDAPTGACFGEDGK